MVYKTHKTKKRFIHQTGGNVSSEQLYAELERLIRESRISEFTTTMFTPINKGNLKGTLKRFTKVKQVSLFDACVEKIKSKMKSKYYGNTFGRDYLADFNDSENHVIHYNNGNVYIISFNTLSNVNLFMIYI